ncbi:MAG: DUF1847 domain-containing protein [Thermoplasmata archaeon]|nr:DUF1847 domain-containing protein [Thermoplasmata archaeon]
MKCALCLKKDCYTGKDCVKLKEEAEKGYTGQDLESMKVSTSIEAKYYMQKTRLEELILYAKDMKYEKLGLAFCIGLEKEARIIHEILEKQFEVHSVCCKVCGIDKKSLGLERLHDYEGVEAMCNPIGQAMVLNDEGTQMNIILGLCIGHDILFTKHSDAPVTTLAVKDRVLAHNPLSAIYSNYYLKNRFGGK